MPEDALVLGQPAIASRAAPAGANSRNWRLFAYASALVFVLTWTIVQGKDVHWDAVNYHLYLGYSALNDRFATDFFAAGTPSYINPYAYVPLYLLDRLGVSAIGIAIVFAAFQAIALWLTYELALVAGLPGTGRARIAFALLAVVLAVMSPVLLQGLGSTMVDISTGVFTVAGWLALALSVRDGRIWPVLIAGLLCGLAVGFKLSNGVYAAAALAMAAFVPGSLRYRVRCALAYSMACGAGFLLISVPWSARLWSEFGNPLFPFLNHWFASSEFTSFPLRYERFLPASLQEFLWRPFEMLSARTMVHTEPRAPDLRFAALFILLGVWIGSKRRSTPVSAAADVDAANQQERNAARVLAALATSFTIAWCLWLLTSGNSRYFLPMSFVASVLVAVLLHRFVRRLPDLALVVIALLLLAQGVQIAIGSDWKREGLAWEGPWLRIDAPDRFRKEPYLFLSTSFLSGSVLLPGWHPESGMINISGFYAIGPGRPGGDRAQRLIERNMQRLRILTALPKGVVDRDTLPGPPSDLNIYVRRFGLQIDANDCEFVKLEANLRGSTRPGETRNRWTAYLTCRLVPLAGAKEAYAREVMEVDALFDRIEAICPNLFHPPQPLTEQLPRWVRVYNMGSEIQLWIENGRVLYFAPTKGGDPIDIGSVEAWRVAPQPIDCSRKWAPAFNGLFN